jgi:hypothetical protein
MLNVSSGNTAQRPRQVAGKEPEGLMENVNRSDEARGAGDSPKERDQRPHPRSPWLSPGIMAVIVAAIVGAITASLMTFNWDAFFEKVGMERRYMSVQPYQTAYRVTYFRLVGLLPSAGRQLLDVEDLEQPIWPSEQMDENLKILEDLALEINSMRKLILLSGAVPQEQLEELETSEVRYAMAKCLLHALIREHRNAEWSVIGSDVKAWLERHKNRVKKEGGDRPRLRTNAYLYGWLYHAIASRAMDLGELEEYRANYEKAESCYMDAKGMVGDGPPRLAAAINLIDLYCLGYCVTGDKKMLKSIAREFDEIGDVGSPGPLQDEPEKVETTKGIVGYDLNLAEFYLASRELKKAAALLADLQTWEKSQANEIRERDKRGETIWTSFSRGIYALTLVNAVLDSLPDFPASNGGDLEKGVRKRFDQQYDDWDDRYEFDADTYTRDLLWRCRKALELSSLLDESAKQKAEDLKKNIRARIEDHKDRWFFARNKCYPTLLLKQFESKFPESPSPKDK